MRSDQKEAKRKAWQKRVEAYKKKQLQKIAEEVMKEIRIKDV